MTNVGKRRASRTRIIVRLFCFGVALFACLSFSIEIKSYVVLMDKILLSGQAKNLYGKLIGENWDVVQGVKFNTLSTSDFSLIAHGNGFRNDALENSREAFQVSKAHGLKIFEIDIWTNAEGLHCSHEIFASERVCDLSVLFEGLEKNDTIIIDLKSEFDTALWALVTSQDPVLLKRMVVQLQHPTDALVFKKMVSYFKGAIFTLYRSNRLLEDICHSLDSDAFPVMVINQSKLGSAEIACPNHKFIVHPVKRCDVLMSLMAKSNVKGAFVSQDALNCKN